MINITDIQSRLLRNPEPEEVREMRNRIISAFKDLEFIEEPHQYFLHRPDGSILELPSVSGVIHQFEPPQDWDAIRINKANREGIDPEVLKRQWREKNLISTSNGTKTHFFLENIMRLWIYGESGLDENIRKTQYEDGYLIPYGPKEKAGSDFYQMTLAKDDIYPVMPEAKIYMGYNDTYKLKQDYCGTFDVLMAQRVGDSFVPILMDLKTNASLVNEFSRKKGKMLLPPFQDMYDEPLSMYTLQLSCYQMGIQQLGLQVGYRIIIWVKEDGTYELIDLPDVTDRLRLIL